MAKEVDLRDKDSHIDEVAGNLYLAIEEKMNKSKSDLAKHEFKEALEHLWKFGCALNRAHLAEMEDPFGVKDYFRGAS